MLKPILKKLFSNFYWFFSYLRFKIFLGVLLSFLVGFLDGFGLIMFLPLLQFVGKDSLELTESVGGLGFLVEFVEALGFVLNLETVLFFIILFFVLKGFVKYASLAYRVIMQQKLIKNIRLSTLFLLNQVKFEYFVNSNVGRLQNVLTAEVDRIEQAYFNYFKAVEQIILVFVYMLFAFLADAKFAILVAVGGVLSNFIVKQIYFHTKILSKRFTDDSNAYQGNVIQFITNFKYLRATSKSENYMRRLMQVVQKIENSRKQIGLLSSLLEALREPLLLVLISGAIFIHINFLQGSIGPILISLLFFYRSLAALTSMQNGWNKFLGVSGSLHNLKDLQVTLKNNQSSDGGLPFVKLQHEIILRGVNLSFGDSRILKDITLRIMKNRTTAFVGESGSGKTTVINVICGLLPPSNGEMFIDGIQIQKLQRNTFQRRIGYITQEPVIFSDTIYNNVTFWSDRTNENEQKCIEALKKASIFDFVNNQLNGLDTILGNNGINLSGGQKQRISIARELYRDIDLLIMDEATSALDSETENSIQENIEALKSNYTLLVVAHRLSTLKNADSVVFMDKGGIIEQDSFHALLERNSRFRNMVELQKS